MALQPSDTIRDTHLKSLLDVVLESSQKRLNELRTQLKDDPKKLAQKEREFMFKECAKLENIGDLQAQLDDYRAKHSSSSPKDKNKETKASNNSEKLGNHLRAIGQYKPNSHWHAHHIICSKHGTHAAARFKLFAYMGINDPFNGCWLPTNHKYATNTPIPSAVGHRYIHTNKYANFVRQEVRPATSKDDLIRRLRDIRRKLHNATKEPSIVALLTENGQEDLRTSH